MAQIDTNRLRELLEAQYEWPALYTFKFVVPCERVEQVEMLFRARTDAEVRHRPSRNQRYVGVTIRVEMPSAEAVVRIYEAAAEIPNMVSL